MTETHKSSVGSPRSEESRGDMHYQPGDAEDGSSRPDSAAGASAPALTELPARDATALVRSVSERLRRAIILGELEAGTRVNQVEVAKQLGVSRMPVRAAVAELQADGLLDPLPNGGVAVRVLTPTDVANHYEIRTALEAQAARHVAQHWVDLSDVLAVLADHARLGGAVHVPALLELDRRFHMAILDGTGNPDFRRAILPNYWMVQRATTQALTVIPAQFDVAWSQHTEIVEAIRSRDPELAAARMRGHLEISAETIVEAMTPAPAG
jgi:DNA-binding GntR family transcriptional regulator